METMIIDFDNTINTVTYAINHELKLKNQQFIYLTLSGAKYEKCTFENITFTNCTFQSTKFIDCTFVNCKFVNCNFLFSELNNCNLLACTMQSCKLEITHFNFSTIMSSVISGNTWDNSTLNDCESTSFIDHPDYIGVSSESYKYVS